MDEQTLESLRAAFSASPDNMKLLGVLLTALLDKGDVAQARQIVEGAELDGVVGTEEGRLVARVWLEAGELARALEAATGDAAATGDEAENSLLRARILTRLDRREEAAQQYAAAVEKNPTLQDLELESLLKAKVRELDAKGGPKLRVISNDDTDATEITRLLVPETEKVTFEDVGGLEEVKKQITRKIILPFKKPSLFQRFKKRAGGGILLYGPPGCGKTLLARATAGECRAEFFNVAIADVLDMYIGESERKLHALFDKARSSAPAILFFDELEALAGKRQYTRESTSSKLVSQFLSEMDGFTQNNSGVLILGATNVPWAVDSAFRRAGRFDRVLFVPPPDREGREEILKRKLDERPTSGKLRLDTIAQKTSGFSGADLDNVVETASDEAIEESLDSGDETPINAEHLKRALEQVKPTTQEWLTTARNYARYANEAGQYDEVLAFLKKHGKT